MYRSSYAASGLGRPDPTFKGPPHGPPFVFPIIHADPNCFKPGLVPVLPKKIRGKRLKEKKRRKKTRSAKKPTVFPPGLATVEGYGYVNVMQPPYAASYPYPWPLPGMDPNYYKQAPGPKGNFRPPNMPGFQPYPFANLRKVPDVESEVVDLTDTTGLRRTVVPDREIGSGLVGSASEETSDSDVASFSSAKALQKKGKRKNVKQRKAKRKCLSASSKFKGVSWHKRDRCYMARVWVDGTSKHVGSYQQEMRAALAVDYTLLSMGKDASHLNFPLQLERDIAASILKHQTVSQNISKSDSQPVDNSETESSSKSCSEEETTQKGVDRNGFPNCIFTVLGDLMSKMNERKCTLEKAAAKNSKRETGLAEEQPKPKNPKWDSLVEAATNQPEIKQRKEDNKQV